MQRHTDILLAGGVLLAASVTAMADEVTFKHKAVFTAGVNSHLDEPTYVRADIDLSAQKIWENGFGARASLQGEYKYYDKKHKDNEQDAHFLLLDAITPVGTLSYGGIHKKGAAELFYKKIDGMALKAKKYERKYNSLRWQGEVAEFGYAISARDVDKQGGDALSFGAGYQAKQWSIGIAHDRAALKQPEVTGVTLQYQHELGSVKNRYIMSHMRKKTNHSHATGVAVQSKLNNGWTLGAHYAWNSAKKSANGYGLSAQYQQDNWQVKGKWSFTEKRQKKAKLSGKVTLTDVALHGIALYAGYEYKEHVAKDTGFYTAALFDIDKQVGVGVSYSKVQEAGDLDLLKGTSLFFRATF